MTIHRQTFLDLWRLQRNGNPFNPFTLQPPESPADRALVFTGAEEDVDSIVSQLMASPCGVVIHGMFGVGKTMVTYEALRRSEYLGALPIYVSYQNQDNTYTLVLRELARALSSRGDAEALKVDEVLRRGEHSYEIKHAGELGPEGMGFKLGSYTRESSTTKGFGVLDPRGDVEALAARARENYGRVILAIDNLERHANEERIRQVVNDVKELQRFGCSVIVIGHPLGVTRNLAAASEGGVFADAIQLEPLAPDQLTEMMAKYLALGRAGDSAVSRTHPFTAPAAREIAERIVRFGLTPRSFQFVCRFFLEHFAKLGEAIIDVRNLEAGFERLSHKIRRGLDDLEMEDLDIQYRTLVRKIRVVGRLSEEPDDPVLESLESTFLEQRPKLAKLEEVDVVIGEKKVGPDGSETIEYRVTELLFDNDLNREE